MEKDQDAVALGTRMRAAIDLSLMNQGEFAKKAQIGANTLSNYVNGKRVPDALVLARIARLSNVDPGWLLTGRGTMIPLKTKLEADFTAGRPVSAEPNAAYQREPTVRIPIYDARVGAGNGAIPGEDIVGYGEVLRRFLVKQLHIFDISRAFIVEVLGHSMKRLYHDGDLVIGELVDEYAGDATYACRWQEELYIKHVRRTPRGVQLISENPSFPPIDIPPEDVENELFQVVGRIAGKMTGQVTC